MMTPWGRCRRCGRVTYRRGPCPTCRVYGEYGVVDRIEVVAPGTVAELRRWRKEAMALRKLFRLARREEDALRIRVLRAERVRCSLGRWMREMEKVRGEME